MCGGRSPAQAANDGMNQAALDQVALSKEQLAWAKELYKETAPDRAEATRRTNVAADAQLDSMKLNDAISKDYSDYAKKTFRPLEEKMVADAEAYDTDARKEQNAGRAVADIAQQFDNTATQSSRTLSRMGVNPSSGAALATSNQMGLGKAVATAAAANKARLDTETQGYARKSDAANLGRGLASAQATSAGVALNAGNSSVGSSAAVGNIAARGNSIMQQGFSGAASSMAGAANTYSNLASSENAGAARADAKSAQTGQMIGMGAMAI